MKKLWISAVAVALLCGSGATVAQVTNAAAGAPIAREVRPQFFKLPNWLEPRESMLSGPAWINLDFSLFRQFAMTERTQLEFRTELFNLTNTPHFYLPSQYAGSSSFMQITQTSAHASQRVIRFGLKLMF